MPERHEVVVIGAGQAGLALGYFLKRSGLDFVLLESAGEVGYSWRERWDSLTLFTPAEFASLPGMALPLPAGVYPGKDDIATYLQRYAEEFDLPVRLASRVKSVERSPGGYRVETEHEILGAAQVVAATGPFRRPYVPFFAEKLGPRVLQLHSSGYRNPQQLPAGRVVVVGAGNSGWQIAEEAAATHEVVLAGRMLPRVPRRLLTRSLFWWLERTGIMRVPARSALGRRMERNDDVVIGELPRRQLATGRLKLAPRAVDASGDRIEFDDGSVVSAASVVWATGYRPDFDWLRLPVLDEAGRPVHRRGVTDQPGFYFLGLRWQHTTGSALLGWVGRDAAFIAQQIEALSGKGSG